ncbi:transposase [Spiroplasma endosymbiont of Monopis laevigella]|uniref:transposase n=1 Tax=Spiroplasma endosymbiont of Monopis laevigella TaxID=3066312 RepID=UPI0030D1AC64
MVTINSYSDEFKKQIVALYQSGKSVSCLVKEYNVTRAATYNWIKQFRGFYVICVSLFYKVLV